jgi:serine/threonine protein kinase
MSAGLTRGGPTTRTDETVGTDPHTDGRTTGAPDDAELTRAARPRPHASSGTVELRFIGDYAIVEQIGEGGMGAVYLAEDLKLGRKVAVKTMRPELAADKANRERFEREARAAAKVEHESIVPIWSVGEAADGTPFIAMPLLKGEMLADRLKRQPVAGLSVLLKVAREVAEGLAAAHAAGLVHRDIKPGNIWLEGDTASKDLTQQIRRCKILDFGLARSIEKGDTHLTATGAILGTPAYMAPEQAMAQAVDHRTDLFSLGVTLFRMATGKMPFEGDTAMAVIIAITTTMPPPVRTLSPNLPPAFANLIDQLMFKDPAARPQSAGEVVAAVRQIVKDIQNRTSALTAVPPPRRAPAAPPVETPATLSSERTEADIRVRPPAAAKAKAVSKAELSLEPDPEPAPAPKRPSAKAQARKRAKREQRRRRALIGWGVALFALAAVALAVIRFATADGTLVVELDDPDVEARFKNGKLVLVGPDGKDRYTVTATEHDKKVHTGAYTVRVEGADGLAVDTPEFTLKRNGKVTVRVTRDPKAPKKAEPPKPAPAANPDPDRAAAEYALSVGGIVRIGGKPDEIKAAKDLPKDRFELTDVNLFGNQAVTDEGMKAFAGCAHLTGLNVSSTNVSDAGLAHCKASKGLQFFSAPAKMTDAGLALFDDCKDLRTLWMGGSRVTNAGLAVLRTKSRLADFRFSDSPLDDTGLAQLKECKELTLLYCPGTKVTAQGVADFAQAVPKCKIDWAGGTVEPRP